MITSRHQHAGKNHNVTIGNKSSAGAGTFQISGNNPNE